MYYSKEIDVKEKLNEQVSQKTLQDIEDFLLPKFDTKLPDSRRKWRIVQDGHGRWREVKIDLQDEMQGKYRIPDKCLPNENSITQPRNKLSFSNNMLNSVKGPVVARIDKSGRSSRQDSNYKMLSTNTRANIFPGKGKHNWFSQSNNVYTQSALKLGDQGGHDLQDGFYGITRDALGAWNEASVHHERMKKAWDVYLESITKPGAVLRRRKEPDQNNVDVSKVIKETKKVKISNKKQTHKETGEEIRHNENEFKVVDDKSNTLQETLNKDDDFWDFYEQPFSKS
ncbi:uncharacterized protein LOC114542125 [Dendronephthya gigantea]|uniref:uncharacterized protein LOC114535918 n=1 Tax=Dendronephthya gigantea TaxID=151771 RepID=UPI00106B0EE2|nr:uncharacterized protein LOC114535918 [Dendronephthya gigantea]XP_028417672.1 uncharacterized protein LOC114542125 [Dendronephthya gigantea]